MLVYLYRYTELREFLPVDTSYVIVLLIILVSSGSRTISALQK